MMSRFAWIGGMALLILLGTGNNVFAEENTGARIYKRCAACHLADGAGVPGAFPPLAGRIEHFAATNKGRAYLVMVISKGLVGPLEIDGVTYRGMMPGQGSTLKNEGITEVLNYMLETFPDLANTSVIAPFTVEEVGEITAAHPKANARTTHEWRDELVGSETVP